MMLATVLLDPPTTLMAGAILALVSMKLLPKGLEEVWRVGQFAGAWGLVYALSVGWHFFFRTDWMFVYLFDTASVPLVPAYLVFVAICVAFGIVGGLGVGLLLHLRKTAAAWLVSLGAVASLAACFAITLDQYLKVGTTAEYLAGTAKKLTDDGSIMLANNVSPAVFGLTAVGIIVLQIRRMRVP
jgi:hypothetical protein